MKVSEEKEAVHKALGMSQHKESAKTKELLHQLERWANNVSFSSRESVSTSGHQAAAYLINVKSINALRNATGGAKRQLQRKQHWTRSWLKQGLCISSLKQQRMPLGRCKRNGRTLWLNGSKLWPLSAGGS